MRQMLIAFAASLATSGVHASDLDLNDPASLCAIMAERHNWAQGSEAIANCSCSMGELQKAMTPSLFEITMRWQLDPSSLDSILPEGMGVAEFYDTVGPKFGAAEEVCGSMR